LNSKSPDTGNLKVLQELDFTLPHENPNWDELLAAITRQVAFMLTNKTEALMQALYRLDVREYKLRAVLDHEAPEKWAASIARLIVEREKERLMWRQKYAGFNPTEESENAS
jgi:L-rhamnose mutarotase